MEDLEQDIRNGPAPEMAQRPDLKISIDAGTRALIAVPVREGGEIKGGLCLLSKKKGLYSAEARQTMERLMLDQAMVAVLRAIERDENFFITGLVKKIAEAKDLRDLARTVVDELARFYDFDNTEIWKVNAPRRRFEILAQALRVKDGTRTPEDSTLPLDKGILGLTYRRGNHVILDNPKGDSEEARRYLPFAPEIQSELCIPICLLGRVLWILNVEDRRTCAFTPLELATLQRVITEMQVTLDRMFQRDFLNQVLDMFPYAVVVVQQDGNVLRCNEHALHMFERDTISSGDNLTLYRSNNALEIRTRNEVPTEQESPVDAVPRIVKGKNGKETSVLISKFTLPEEYDHVVMVLNDLSELKWKTEFESLKAALAESAEQTRVPVSLLASYIQQIDHRTSDQKLRDLTAKALRQIGRIELTYDRVLASYDAQSLSPPQKVRLDVGQAIEHVLSELPQLERSAVSFASHPVTAVNADPYRLLFALSSMLAYLLRSRPNAERIVVNVRQPRGSIEVCMTGAVQQRQREGELAALVETTRSQIALGEGALARMAAECGGSFERRQQPSGRERLALRLPAAD